MISRNGKEPSKRNIADNTGEDIIEAVGRSDDNVLNASDTLYIPEPRTSLDTHLCIIISDPDVDAEKIVIVNMTSYRDHKDMACVLNVGDHPRIQQSRFGSRAG